MADIVNFGGWDGGIARNYNAVSEQPVMFYWAGLRPYPDFVAGVWLEIYTLKNCKPSQSDWECSILSAIRLLTFSRIMPKG